MIRASNIIVAVNLVIVVILTACVGPRMQKIGIFGNIVPSSDTTTVEASGLVKDWMTDASPFSPRSCLEIQVAGSSRVIILLKDILKDTLYVIADDSLLPGKYEVCWPLDPPSGFYRHFVTLGTLTVSSKTFVWHHRGK
jgi:hypothetical protein